MREEDIINLTKKQLLQGISLARKTENYEGQLPPQEFLNILESVPDHVFEFEKTWYVKPDLKLEKQFTEICNFLADPRIRNKNLPKPSQTIRDLYSKDYENWKNFIEQIHSIRDIIYSATFFGKLKDIKLGFFVRNLSNEERVEKHLNSGVYTFIIMEDGPASNSELAEGDIIIKVGDKKIKNIDDIITFKHESLEKVKIEFLRDGQKKTTTLNLKEIKK
jgi:hypothetical protein